MNPLTHRLVSLLAGASCVALLLFGLVPAAHAERATIGPHVGYNFDGEELLLGVESRIDLGNAGSSVIVQLNPSLSYYFFENVDVFNFSLNVPFEFVIQGSVLRPFVAPGLALFFGDFDEELRLNLIGGLLFKLGAVEPFVQLRAAVIDGDVVDLMGGLLIRL
jgi:hypothetical protein